MYSLEPKSVLKIYCDTTDKKDSIALWEYVLESSKEHNLAGATVYKAVAGLGEHKQIHTFELVSLSNTMPIVIEIIDSKDKIESFLESVVSNLKDVFVTLDTTNKVVVKEL